jgi:hypothetical protein
MLCLSYCLTRGDIPAVIQILHQNKTSIRDIFTVFEVAPACLCLYPAGDEKKQRAKRLFCPVMKFCRLIFSPCFCIPTVMRSLCGPDACSVPGSH